MKQDAPSLKLRKTLEDRLLPNPELLSKIPLATDWPETSRFALYVACLGGLSHYQNPSLEDAISGAVRRFGVLRHENKYAAGRPQELAVAMIYLISDALSKSSIVSLAQDRADLGIPGRLNDLCSLLSVCVVMQTKTKSRNVDYWRALFEELVQGDKNSLALSLAEQVSEIATTWTFSSLDHAGTRWTRPSFEEIQRADSMSTKVSAEIEAEDELSTLEGRLVHAEGVIVDTPRFAELLEGSLSLNLQEKERIIKAFPTLSQFQIDELIKVFEEEIEKFSKFEKEHEQDIRKLREHNSEVSKRMSKRIKVDAEKKRSMDEQAKALIGSNLFNLLTLHGRAA